MGSLKIPNRPPHIVILPFMAQGHTIPLLHLTRLLLLRGSATVTIFTTAGNAPPIRASLHDTSASILELPFPQNIDSVPPGVENTQHLPSMFSFLPFVQSTKLMQPDFDKALQTLDPPVSAIISDAFMGWTLESANKLGIPRFVFFGMCNFSNTMVQILTREKPHANTVSLDDPFLMPGFPGRELTRNDFEAPYNEIEPSGPFVEFMEEQIVAMATSHGLIVNSFYELESQYVDYWNANIGPKAFCVGPLCMAAAKEVKSYEFLDKKLSEEKPVLYVAFGTQAKVSAEQMGEIAKGLERSGVSFLWALGKGVVDFIDIEGFEERVRDRGVVVREWVDQVGILRHGGVKGFLSHCGWNSVVESVSAAVPMVAMPFMAEQHLNARFVAEEAGVGLRVMPADGGSVRGMVAAEEVERAVRELMCGGERGAAVRRKAEEYGATAGESMREGGSSMRTLDLLMEEIGGLAASFSGGEGRQDPVFIPVVGLSN